MTIVDTNTEEKQLSLFDAVLDHGAAVMMGACLVFWIAVGTALYLIF